MADECLKKYRKAVKDSKNNKELDTVLNKLYDDGFENGTKEGNE